jgi:hypothetical protein
MSDRQLPDSTSFPATADARAAATFGNSSDPAKGAALVGYSGAEVPETTKQALDDAGNKSRSLRAFNKLFASGFGVTTLTAFVFGDSMAITKFTHIVFPLDRMMGRANMTAQPATSSAQSTTAGCDLTPYNYVGGAAWTKTVIRRDLWPVTVTHMDDGDEIKWFAGGGNPRFTIATIMAFQEAGAGNLEIRVGGTLVQTLTLNGSTDVQIFQPTQSVAQTEIRVKAVGGPVNLPAQHALDASTSGLDAWVVGEGGLGLNYAMFKSTCRANLGKVLAVVNPDFTLFEMKEDTDYGVILPLVFTGGGGSGAEGYAPVAADGTIGTPVVLSGGSGYSTAPTVTITAATGSGAAITATVANGAVATVSRGNPGSAYTAGAASVPDRLFSTSLGRYNAILDANCAVADKVIVASMPVGGAATSGSDAFERTNARIIKDYCNANRPLGYVFIDAYRYLVDYNNIVRAHFNKQLPLTNSGATDDTHLSPPANAYIAQRMWADLGFDVTLWGMAVRAINDPTRASYLGKGSRVYGNFSDLYLETNLSGIASDTAGYHWRTTYPRSHEFYGTSGGLAMRLNLHGSAGTDGTRPIMPSDYCFRDESTKMRASLTTDSNFGFVWNLKRYNGSNDYGLALDVGPVRAGQMTKAQILALSAGAYDGFQTYCTDLHIPVFSNGTVWKSLVDGTTIV